MIPRCDWRVLSEHKPFPGKGRGPVGKVEVTERGSGCLLFPTWATAFAGEQGRRIAGAIGQVHDISSAKSTARNEDAVPNDLSGTDTGGLNRRTCPDRSH